MKPNLIQRAVSSFVKESPKILPWLAVGGFFTAIGLAIKATPVAEDRIVEAEDAKGAPLTKVETIKAAAPAYVPTIVTALVSAGTVLWVSYKNNVLNAELATAYAMSQAYIKRLDDKTAETVGEDKAAEIKKAVQKEVAETYEVKKAVSKLPKIEPPKSDGLKMVPYYDILSNTPFYANDTIIERTELALNKRLYAGEPYVSVSDMYDELNSAGAYPPLKDTATSVNLGWDRDVKFCTSDHTEWDDGTSARILGYAPRREPTWVTS
jgi:hypothetical protein